MITLILLLHLSLAAMYTLAIIAMTIAAASGKNAPRIKRLVVTSFSGTLTSGAILVIVSPKALAQFCTSALLASLFGAVAWTIYKHRITAMQPQDTTLY